MINIKRSSIFLIILFFVLNFTIVISKTSLSDFELFGYKFNVKTNESIAAPEQKYKMSMGRGCICSGEGEYWVSCHLPSFLNECSIMPCTCFDYPDPY